MGCRGFFTPKIKMFENLPDIHEIYLKNRSLLEFTITFANRLNRIIYIEMTTKYNQIEIKFKSFKN